MFQVHQTLNGTPNKTKHKLNRTRLNRELQRNWLRFSSQQPSRDFLSLAFNNQRITMI